MVAQYVKPEGEGIDEMQELGRQDMLKCLSGIMLCLPVTLWFGMGVPFLVVAPIVQVVAGGSPEFDVPLILKCLALGLSAMAAGVAIQPAGPWSWRQLMTGPAAAVVLALALLPASIWATAVWLSILLGYALFEGGVAVLQTRFVIAAIAAGIVLIVLNPKNSQREVSKVEQHP